MTDGSTIATSRLATFVLERGTGEPVIFVHGNVSDAEVWREQVEALPDGFRGIAVDLRGYGRSERRPADPTRGLADFSEDLAALVDTLGLGAVHLVGHSMGAGACYAYAIDRPDRVRSITVAAPMSPFGFGGTRDDGRPWFPDCAGSGGGAANPEFVRLLAEEDRSADSDASPRNIIRGLFFPDPSAVRHEDAILESMLRAELGDDYYPGDARASPNWPGVAPGRRGVLNAISPLYCDLSAFPTSGCAAPLLWVRGDRDAVISDTSMLDFGHLGALGAVPGWPGGDVCPPQPMNTQTRDMLTAYSAAGGRYREEVFDDAGHFCFTQRPERFASLLHGHLREAAGSASGA